MEKQSALHRHIFIAFVKKFIMKNVISRLKSNSTYPIVYFDSITFVSLNITRFWLILREIENKMVNYR